MYKNYLFDLYGTLIDINTDEENDKLWENMCVIYKKSGADYKADELKSEYIKLVEEEKKSVHLKIKDTKYIDVQLEKVFKNLYINKKINVDNKKVADTAQAFRTLSTKYIKLYDGAMELLNTLKEKGKKVYLLTNAQRCFTMQEIINLKIVDKFDGIVISSDELVCKPEKSFYEIILNRYNLNKDESIMIGNDYITDIQGSYEIGLDNLYVHTNLSLEINGKLNAKFKVMDGDVNKIKGMIIN